MHMANSWYDKQKEQEQQTLLEQEFKRLFLKSIEFA